MPLYTSLLIHLWIYPVESAIKMMMPSNDRPISVKRGRFFLENNQSKILNVLS